MKNIYISYSHHSSDNIDIKKFVNKVTADLDDCGHKVWLDKRDFNKEGQPIGISPGTPFDIAMEVGLRDCDVILYFITKMAVTNRSVCRKEIIYGFHLNKPTLSVLISDVQLPQFLYGGAYFDFRDGFSAKGVLDLDKYELLLAKIVEVLQII